MRFRAAMLCTLVAAGCGGSDGASPDAAVSVDAGQDAAADAGPDAAAVTRSLAVTPASHDFGAVQLGCSLSSVFHVTSTGNAAVGPLATSLVGSAAFRITADTCNGQSLPPTETCDVTVGSQPSTVGTQSALLTVTAGPIQTSAPLTAVALAAAPLTIAPNLQNYGRLLVGQSSAPVTYTVTNGGGVPVGPLAKTVTGPDAASFVQVTDACNGMLNPGGSCTMSIRFAPTTVGAKTATLNVMGSGPCGYATATLTGTGVVSDLSLTPGTQDFGAVGIGTSSSDVVFTATNTGAATTAVLTVALTGTDAGTFTIAGGTCMSGTTTLGPGAGCSVLVHASPASAGPKSASLSVAPAGGTAALATLTATAVIRDDIITISPSSQDFGPVVVGTSGTGMVFTVTNIGGVSQGPLGVSRSGSDPSNFVITADGCSGVSLAAGTTCTITLAFAPSSSSAKYAALDVTTPIPAVHASAALGGTGFTP